MLQNSFKIDKQPLKIAMCYISVPLECKTFKIHTNICNTCNLTISTFITIDFLKSLSVWILPVGFFSSLWWADGYPARGPISIIKAVQDGCWHITLYSWN